MKRKQQSEKKGDGGSEIKRKCWFGQTENKLLLNEKSNRKQWNIFGTCW